MPSVTTDHGVHRRRSHRGVETAVLLSNGLQMAVSGTIFTLIAELQDDIGFSDVVLGLFVATSFVSSVIAMVGLSRYSDRGHATTMLVGGPLLAGVGCLIFAATSHAPLLLVARFVIGVGYGVTAPAARRFVSLLHSDTPGRALGRLNFAEGIGLIAGAPIGAGLAEQLNVAVPFILFGILCLAVAVILGTQGQTLRIMRASTRDTAQQGAPDLKGRPVETDDAAQRHDSRSHSNVAIIKRLELRPAFLLSVAFWLNTGMFEVVWPRMLTDLGYSAQFISATVVAYGVPLALAAPAAGRVLERRRPVAVGIAAMLVTAAILPLYATHPPAALLMIIAGIEGIAGGFMLTALQTAAAVRAPAEEAGRVQGLLEASGTTAAVASSLIAGLLLNLSGPGAPLYSTAVVLAFMGLRTFQSDQRSSGMMTKSSR
ncbi:MAG: MFS transporter [Actinobacteria bacterium]|nr:MFS transporter [Actinomycetota bacterium]